LRYRVNPDVSAETHPYISTGLHQHKFGVPIPRRGRSTLWPHSSLSDVAGVSVHMVHKLPIWVTFQEALGRVADRCVDCAGKGMTFGMSTPAVAWEFRMRGRREFRGADCRVCAGCANSLRGLNVHLLLELDAPLWERGVLLARFFTGKRIVASAF